MRKAGKKRSRREADGPPERQRETGRNGRSESVRHRTEPERDRRDGAERTDQTERGGTETARKEKRTDGTLQPPDPRLRREPQRIVVETRNHDQHAVRTHETGQLFGKGRRRRRGGVRKRRGSRTGSRGRAVRRRTPWRGAGRVRRNCGPKGCGHPPRPPRADRGRCPGASRTG